MKELRICEFSKYPGPRFKLLGSSSGEQFRDEILIPALLEHDEVAINFDNVIGYGSSFLEEVFGGLVRKVKNKECLVSIQKIKKLRENLISLDDPSVVTEVQEYIDALGGNETDVVTNTELKFELGKKYSFFAGTEEHLKMLVVIKNYCFSQVQELELIIVDELRSKNFSVIIDDTFGIKINIIQDETDEDDAGEIGG